MLRKALCLVTAVILVCVFSFTALAADNSVAYYDANGNQVYGSGMYYGRDGCPYYSNGCYYVDANGNNAYVGGCRIYYYDADGNLVPGSYYYDSEGNAVSPPAMNGNASRGGCCRYRG